MHPKFGVHLEFAKAHHKTTPRGKVGMALGCGSKKKYLGFPFNIPAMVALFVALA